MNVGGPRGILVALDASHQSRAAVEAGAELAAVLGVELLGLFVEDMNLIHLAGLPFAREMMWLTSTECELDARRMERMLRAWAADARSVLLEAAGRRQVTGSFRVVRGRVVTEILTAASATDLIILGTGGYGGATQRGSTAYVLAMQAPGPVLLLRDEGAVGSPAVMVLEQRDDLSRMLRQALPLLSLVDAHELIILALGADEIAAGNLTADLIKLRPAGVRLEVKPLPVWDIPRVIRVVRSLGAHLLVLPGTSEIVQEAGLHALFPELDCPVLVLR